MSRYRLSALAEADLDDIWLRIAQDGHATRSHPATPTGVISGTATRPAVAGELLRQRFVIRRFARAILASYRERHGDSDGPEPASGHFGPEPEARS